MIKRLRGAIVIPLTASAGWQPLEFSRIPANRIEYQLAGVHVYVQKSAGALIRAFDQPQKVDAFHLELDIHGKLPAARAFPEDAYLRVGLVVPGDRKPNALERLFAPGWIKQLFKLAPKDKGIDKIEFFNVTAPGQRVGDNRVFPKSKGLMRETLAVAFDGSRDSVSVDYRLPQALDAAALWLSVDGDDTGSSFDIVIRKLVLSTVD